MKRVAVANTGLMPIRRMRPPSPATRALMPKLLVPGSLFLERGERQWLQLKRSSTKSADIIGVAGSQ
jgi:hypothetical protein